jgi:hypothetical protein
VPARTTLLAAFISAAVFTALAAREARIDGPTFDETTYIIAGSLMGDGVDPGNHEHPPLAKLLFLGAQRLFSPRLADAETWLTRGGLWSSRAVTIVAGAALCGMVAAVASAHGFPAALVAGLSAALLPEILAHGHLATLDVLLTLFFWAGCVATDAFARRPKTWRLALVAVSVAAAVLTKWTGFALVALLPLSAFVARPGSLRERARASWPVLAACACGLVLVLGAYAATLGLDSLARGLEFQRVHAKHGHAVVFLGRVHEKGTPLFYVVGLAVTTPFALWPLAALGARAIPRRAALWLPALALLVVFSFLRVQLGVRYVLPVYMPLAVAAGAGFARLGERGRPWLAAALAACFAASSLAYDSHLAYRNELRFFSRWRGLEWLPESDGDWGQGGPVLAADVERLGIERVCIAWYWGTFATWRAIPSLLQRSAAPGTCDTGAVGTYLLFSEKRFAPLRERTPLNPGRTVLLFDLKNDPALAAAWAQR